MKKSLLVTGGAGFIGSQFVHSALLTGYDVVILDALTYAGHLANLQAPLRDNPRILVKGDIRDRELVATLLRQHNVDAIIHFAAESHVDRSISGPDNFIQTNINGTYNLLECARAHYAELPEARKSLFRYVHISTDEVYGALGPEGYFTELSPMQPNSPYSASKASSDLLVRAWNRTYKLPTITTNCSNNYGPRQFPEKLIPLMILSALKEKPLPVYGNGSNVRDWIHVEDHCNGIMLALERGTPGETYCLSGHAELSNLQVVREICRILDELRPRQNNRKYSELITFVADRLGHDWRYAIDDSLAQKSLGFKPKHTNFKEGLSSTIQWYLQNPDWLEAVTKDAARVHT